MRKKTWYIAGIITTVLLGWSAQIGYFVAYGPRYPVNIQLRESDCRLSDQVPSKVGPAVPCRFTAALFHSDSGWVGYGVSDNVKGQCLWLAEPLADTGSFALESDGDPVSTLPDKCMREYADQHPRNRLF